MKQSINIREFERAFCDYDREDNFTTEGLVALYDFIEQLDEGSGTDTELDVVALCCEFTEYADLAEFQSNHSDEYQSIDDISDQTIVIRVNSDRFIIQDF